MYCIQQKREYYDQWGKGVAEEVAVSPLYTGPPLKILPKMYLHMPDGSVHEMMEDNGPGTGDELHDRYSAAGIPYEITTRDWESTDGSQIQVKLGDRGSSYDVLAYDASTLYVANLGPGFRVVDISNPSQIGSQNVDTPWGATRLIRLDNYLLVGTNGAGVQLYDITSPLSPSYVYKSWLNKGGVVDMKYESNTRRLWVLGDGKLRVLDMSRPRYAKELAACDADTGYTYWGSAASPLEVSGQYGYVSQEGEIGIYYCSGTKLSRSPLSFRSDRFRLDHYKCLVQDPAQHKLYALVDTGSGKRVEAFMIEADGQLGQLPLESFTVSRLGNRMVLSGNHLLILGIPSSTGGCGVDTYDRTNPAGSFSSHTLFTTAYRPRSTGLAVSADGSQFFFTGDSWFLSAFNRDAFLDGGSVSLWDYIPVQHDPAIYFPNGTRVILTAEYQTVMDANGNFIRMSQPVNSSGTFTYQDTLGRSGLTSVLPWYTPPTEGGSSPIPGYNPWLDPPPDPIDYTLPGFNGASKTYSFLYRPLSEFATVALTSRGPDLEYIEELPCADNPHALFPASGTSYAPQIVENVTCFNPLLLKQITLPNGRCYLFEYNEYGEITKITYPTTGYEIFEYDRVPLVGWQYDRYANWVNRGVTKRFISAKGDGTDLCAYVYEGEQVLVGGAGGSSTYYRVIQRVKFYADAGQIGGTPDALEEHYFYKVDHRNHWMVAYGLEPLCSGKEYETRLYLKDAASGQMKLHQRVLREYAAGVYNPAIALHHPYSSKLLGFRNPLVTAELTFHFDAAGQPQRASLVTWEYEQAAALNSYFKYGRLIEKKSYDYIDTLNSLALAAYHPELGLGGWIGGGAFGPSDLLRVEKTEYDNTPSFLALDLVQMVSRSWVEDGAVNKVSEALFDYDDPECFDGVTGGGVPNWQDVGAVRGNLSHVSRWIDGANYSADTRTVNRFGRVIQYQDPVAQTTGWEYGDDCSGAYVTAMVKHPEPDLELRTGYDYDCTTGKLLAVADPNEATATFDYADDLDRLTQAVEPNGREIGLAYDDANRIITVTADWDPDTDPLMHQETVRHFDGLGRLTAEAVKVGPASAPSWRWSQREYDARGRLWKVYNPAASQGTVGVGVTTTTYDSLDRVITVENPDQTTRTTQYDLFNVSSTTPTVAEKVSDESGKWKKYSRDSAGRIVQVIEEDPDTDTDGPVTTYAYTPSGKLSEVHQDAQTRSFAYDGLGNLVSAQYPEIEFEKTWEYFDNGQLRREYNGLSNDETPLPQYVLFRYDGMGRIIRKYHTCLETIEGYTEELIRRKYVYSYDGQYLPYQAESFDFGAYALGKLTGKWETWGNDEVDPGDPVYWMELYAFSDPSGRLTAQLNWLDLNDVFSFGPYLTTYGYNLSGGLTGISYPSGKQATFTLDLENKPINAGTESSRAVLASSLTYALHGALDTVTVPFAGETARTDLTYHRAYTNDQMLRVDKITLTQSNPGDLMDFQYSYAANGNVAGITHSDFGGVHSETFEYDKLNRLTSVSYTLDASPGSGSIGYRYDRFGNLNARTVQMPEGATDARSFDLGATSMEDDNRLPESAGAYTFTYDERGNLVAAVEVVGVEDTIEEAFSYDAENRLENYNRTWTDPETELTMWAEGRYFYDDSFRRLCAVQTISQSENEYIHNITTGTIYDLGGDVLTEIIWENGNPFPEQGKKLPSSPQTLSEEAYHYQFLDHLGTTRFIAGMSWQWGLIEEIPQFVQTNTWLRPVNLTPYGSEIREVSGARYEPDALVLFDPILFTGKPRDFESGLDYFGARYYSNTWCRWLGADQPFVDYSIRTPLSWSRYIYTRNNPVILYDSNGTSATVAGGVIGGVFGGMTSMICQFLGKGTIEWNEVGAYTMGGAVAGAVAGSIIDTFGTDIPIIVAAGGIGGILGGLTTANAQGKQYTPTDAIEDAAVSMGTAYLGARMASAHAPMRLSTKIPTSGRKFNQLSKRGWSQNSIDDLVNNPYTTREAINKATGNKATAYFREDGHYVVRDDVTGDIVQMSDTNFAVGTGKGQWVPDSSIRDPYLP